MFVFRWLVPVDGKVMETTISEMEHTCGDIFTVDDNAMETAKPDV